MHDVPSVGQVTAPERAPRLTRACSSKACCASGSDAATQGLAERLLGNWEGWLPTLSIAIEGIASRVFVYGGSQTTEDFDGQHDRAVQWITSRGLQSATSISDTVKEEIRQRIADGVSQGQTAQEITNSIGGFFDDQSQWRALRIAMTEVIEAYAQGSLEGARQTGLTYKRWITAGHDRTEEERLTNETAAGSSGSRASP